MPLTVAQIAERAVKPGGSKAAFIQRVRHWTRERLLLPLGERHPGTGRHRVYRDSAIHDALILNALADDGVPIAKQREIMKVVRGDLAQHLKQRAEEAKPDLLLVIETYPWQSQPYFHEGQYTTNELAERTTVLNLSRIFTAIAAPPPQSETGETTR